MRTLRHASLLILVPVLLPGAPAGAQPCAPPCGTTIPGGPASGVWTAENSPYCITGDLVIGALDIEAGVCVLVDGPYRIDVANRLRVFGERDRPVTFTSKEPSMRWKGVGFADANPGSELNWCIIEKSDNTGVRIINTSAGATTPLFRHCTIRNNTSPSHAGGMRVSLVGAQALEMEDCEISGNVANPGNGGGTHVGGGIYLTGSMRLRGCLLRGNECYATGNCGGPGIALGGSLYADGGGAIDLQNTSLESNRVHGAGPGCFGGCVGTGNGGAIYLAAGALTLTNCVVAGNTVTGCGGFVGGVWVNGGDATLRNCTIVANASLGLHHAGGTAMVRNSILYFNNGGAAQFGGTPAIAFSDIQGGAPGAGNLSGNPSLIGDASTANACQAALTDPISLCVDAGDPDPAFNDACSPPGLGGPRNDMGAYGGPGNCRWWPPPCYPNLDCSSSAPVLNVGDFVRFQSLFAAGDPRANCDGSGAPMVLNVLDFVCFQQRFAAGCP